MEGPLVSDTTELLSDAAAPAPGETLSGQSAVGPEGTVVAASRPQGRPVGDLSKLLVPDLQKIAQQLGIPGAGRMRKGQLVAAIEEHQIGGRASSAEWIYDPRRRHVIPDDDQAVRLCLPQEEWAAVTFAERSRATATVTPIGSRQHSPYADQAREHDRRIVGAPPRPRDADYAVTADSDSGRVIKRNSERNAS